MVFIIKDTGLSQWNPRVVDYYTQLMSHIKEYKSRGIESQNTFGGLNGAHNLKKITEQCNICARSSRTKKTWPAPLVPVKPPKQAWDKIAFDLKGPLNVGSYKYLLVMVDYFTKWPEVIGLNSISSTSGINAFKTVFYRYGLPREIVSDNGRQFVSSEITNNFEYLNAVFFLKIKENKDFKS